MGKIFQIVGLLLISANTSAQIYKWVDEHGNVHFGDKPVENSEEVTTTKNRISTPSTTSEDRQQKQRRLLNSLTEERQRKEAKKAKEDQELAALEKKCREAKEELQEYREAQYLYRKDENGERVILDDKEHAAALRQAKQRVERYCK